MILTVCIAATLFSAPTDLIAVDQVLIAQRQNGEWTSPGEDGPSVKPPLRFQRFGLAQRYEEFIVDSIEYELGGWIIGNAPEKGASYWGKSLRMPRKVDILPVGDVTSTQMVEAYVKANGVAKPNVVVWQICMSDLDGNGIRERIVAAGSFRQNDLTRSHRRGDFNLLLLRFIDSTGKPRVVRLAGQVFPSNRAEGHTPAVEAFAIPAIADVDSDGIMEIVSSWQYYEGMGGQLWRFDGKRVRLLAESGYGA